MSLKLNFISLIPMLLSSFYGTWKKQANEKWETGNEDSFWVIILLCLFAYFSNRAVRQLVKR